jgi:membrane-bound lytic murein transglycosylase D
MTPRQRRARLMPLLLITLIAALAGCSSNRDDRSSALLSPESPQSVRGGEARRVTVHTNGVELFDSTDESNSSIVPYAVDHNNLWNRIARGLSLDPGFDNAAIRIELDWYREHPAFLYRATENASPYLHYVVKAVEKRGLPMELALLPIVESAYDPFVYSRSGAAGMWQFIPNTGRHFGLRSNQWYDGRRDVVASTEAALDYLTQLYQRFDNDWLLAIAAYNFGQGNVQSAIDANRRRGLPTDFWSLSLRHETHTYVPKLLALGRLVSAPQQYGISLHAIPDRPYFEPVTIDRSIDFSRVAALAGVEPGEIQRLNPGYHHGLTEPAGQQRLLLPIGTADRFRRQLAALPADQPKSLAQRYTVSRGDTLSAIARKFGVSVAMLQSANRLADSTIHPGQTLAIPDASGSHPTVSVPPGRHLLYTVQAGDTQLRIANRHGVTVQELQRWNGLKPDDPVKLGQQLSIWSRGGSQTTAAQSGNQKMDYRVKSGDSLYGIASRFKVGIDDIMRWNRMSNHSLQAGQLLTLYVP